MATLAASWSTSTANTSPSGRSTPDLARPMNPSHPHRQHSTSTSPQPSQASGEVGYHQHPYDNRQQQQSPPTQYPASHNNFGSQQQNPSAHWVPSPTAAPFVPQYPSYFTPSPQFHPPHVYYDPSQQQQQQQQQQFAQWAYQQMIFNAQQQQLANDYQRMGTPDRGSHRNSPQLTPQIHPQPDFYPAHQQFNFTSPIAQQQQQQQQQALAQQTQQSPYQGFHPYRRPGASRQSSNRSNPQEAFPTQNYPSQPYVHTLDSGSSTSLNSGNGFVRNGSPSQAPQTVHGPQVIIPGNGNRQRTTSNRSSDRGSSKSSSAASHTRSESANSGNTHRPSGTRSASVSSTSSNRPASPSTSSSAQSHPSSPATTASSQRRPVKPSPLSQGSTLSAAEERASRRISRDDSELAYGAPITTLPSRSSGLKGRLRRALTLNNTGAAAEDKPEPTDLQTKSSRLQISTSKSAPASQSSNDLSGDSTSPPHTPTSNKEAAPNGTQNGRGKKSLFNIKFNASTDNISLSSTVSSASVMIRKIGSLGKIARRSSIAGITKLFKDKDKKKKQEDAATDDESNRGGPKANRAEPSVTLATAELERGTLSSEDLKGLSPAARLARQHTLKSKAADDAKAKALAEQQLKVHDVPQGDDGDKVPATWERGTAKRNANNSRPPIVMENGTQVYVEEDDEDDSGSNSDSDEEDDNDRTFTREEQWNYQPGPEARDTQLQAEDEDVDEDIGDEDVTIRLGSLEVQDDASQNWSYESNGHRRDLVPAKGILRNAANYDQNTYFESATSSHNPLASQNRMRANSYTAVNEAGPPGPLMRIPSPDPDHIDGLHKTEHHRSSSDTGHDLRLPDFSFEFNDSPLFGENGDATFDHATNLDKGAIFNHPSMNSSAPVLSLSNAAPKPAPLSRTPVRRITFAANLSIYDTFSSTIYDRRCEPVTCNRLTPALAQRIKEELNTYKMEEMEVHAASRIHTHFFV